MLTSVKVSHVATLPPGIKLRLSDAQAAPRALRLKAMGNGLYEVMESVQFKAGEVIDLDLTQLPKNLRNPLIPLPPAKPGRGG
jgi:hypothetical protein